MSGAREIVVEGAILGCTGCKDSCMRKSGPGLNVISQNSIRKGDNLIATDRDIGPVAIPPFPHCDRLGECTPDVTVKWIETSGSQNFQRLIHGESITFCDAGNGIIGTMTSGQNPGEENLSREEEIERVLAFLRHINEWGVEMGGWTVGELTDDILRQIATDYVDVMRAISMLRDENGFINMTLVDQNIWEAFSRLTGNHGTGDLVNYLVFDHRTTIDQFNTFLANNGQMSTWPLVNANAIFGLAMDQAVPNSDLKNMLIGTGALAVIFGPLTAPMWGPAVMGFVTTGATTAPVAMQSLIQQFKKGMITAQQFADRVARMGGNVWQQIKNIFNSSKGKWINVNESMSQLSRDFQEFITGRVGQAWLQNGVRFDGMANGRLIEVKGRYSQFVNSAGRFVDWFANSRTGGQALINQARRQLEAAAGMPIDWYFLDAASMNATKALLKEAGITGINFILQVFP